MSNENKNWTREGAAQNLSQHVGHGMRPETRSKLESLSTGDDSAGQIARDALERQQGYDRPLEDY